MPNASKDLQPMKGRKIHLDLELPIGIPDSWLASTSFWRDAFAALSAVLQDRARARDVLLSGFLGGGPEAEIPASALDRADSETIGSIVCMAADVPEVEILP